MGKTEVKVRLYHMHTMKIIAQIAFILVKNWK